MISSLAPQLLVKQIIAWTISFGLFFIGTQINPNLNQKSRWIFFIGSCIFLILPIILGNITRGSRRWLNIGPVTIQPSEIVKPPLMLFLASGPFPLLHLIPVAIVAMEPDLGSAITILVLLIPILLYSPKLLKLAIVGVVCLTMASPLVWKYLIHDYQKDRVETFINPQHDPLGQGYNLIQSQIAVGSGGFFGKGYRQGTQGQLLFLPEKHTDFIFAATAEELGSLSIILIFFAYIVLLTTLLNKAYGTKHNKPLFLFTLGIFFEIWIQASINIGMNIGVFPVTGIPLPFLSVGGSSLMALLFSLGVIYSNL
ncbi:MAG: FtsW/RodA/SpoVE family cell cycle protein [Candidatus Shapirobacteria bacterium]